MNPRLQHDYVAVEHLEVSGFEHLDLLLVRDVLAVEESRLSKAEKEQLATADRQQRGVSPER